MESWDVGVDCIAVTPFDLFSNISIFDASDFATEVIRQLGKKYVWQVRNLSPRFYLFQILLRLCIDCGIY